MKKRILLAVIGLLLVIVGFIVFNVFHAQVRMSFTGHPYNVTKIRCYDASGSFREYDVSQCPVICHKGCAVEIFHIAGRRWDVYDPDNHRLNRDFGDSVRFMVPDDASGLALLFVDDDAPYNREDGLTDYVQPFYSEGWAKDITPIMIE